MPVEQCLDRRHSVVVHPSSIFDAGSAGQFPAVTQLQMRVGDSAYLPTGRRWVVNHRVTCERESTSAAPLLIGIQAEDLGW